VLGFGHDVSGVNFNKQSPEIEDVIAAPVGEVGQLASEQRSVKVIPADVDR